MPTSWPQPAVLKNLLSSSPNADVADSDGRGANNGTKAPTAPVSYNHRVLALYKFVSPKLSGEDLPALKKELETACRQHSARGTLLIAEEGINGTICYPFQNHSSSSIGPIEAGVSPTTPNDTCGDGEGREKNDDESRDALLAFLQAKFDDSLRIRVSVADRPVFSRLKIKIKSEIVTMHWQGDKPRGTTANGTIEPRRNDETATDECNSSSTASSPPSCGPCRPTERVGEYVHPRDWNKLLMDPDTLVIDTRNEYEIAVGTFRNAINPHTQSFVEFPDWIKRNIVDDGSKNSSNPDSDVSEKRNSVEKKKKIAMFCKYKNFFVVCVRQYSQVFVACDVAFLLATRFLSRLTASCIAVHDLRCRHRGHSLRKGHQRRDATRPGGHTRLSPGGRHSCLSRRGIGG